MTGLKMDSKMPKGWSMAKLKDLTMDSRKEKEKVKAMAKEKVKGWETS